MSSVHIDTNSSQRQTSWSLRDNCGDESRRYRPAPCLQGWPGTDNCWWLARKGLTRWHGEARTTWALSVKHCVPQALIWPLPSVLLAAALEPPIPTFPDAQKAEQATPAPYGWQRSILGRWVRFTSTSMCLPWRMAWMNQNVSASCLCCSPDSGRSIFKQKCRSCRNLSPFRKQTLLPQCKTNIFPKFGIPFP